MSILQVIGVWVGTVLFCLWIWIVAPLGDPETGLGYEPHDPNKPRNPQLAFVVSVIIASTLTGWLYWIFK